MASLRERCIHSRQGGRLAGPDSEDLRGFLRSDPARTVWSPGDGGPGLNAAARSHIAFDDDPLVLASLATMLADDGVIRE
ncbi:hypothetical protein [Streptomyces sp. NPDC051218]|uniref:hypothetical protein n=1 Tax=Streptomyces sp. NPDC051218 TaxID=3365645 RepID=UPI0037AB19C2